MLQSMGSQRVGHDLSVLYLPRKGGNSPWMQDQYLVKVKELGARAKDRYGDQRRL